VASGWSKITGTWVDLLSYRASIYAMSTPSAVARSAPIAIASKKPVNDFSNLSARDKLSASMSSTTSADSGTNTRSRKDRPCDACRRRKSRCVIHEGQTSCVLCQFHSQDCTFVQSPQPRKRKLNTEGKEESSAKRRYVQIRFSLCSIPPDSLPYACTSWGYS